MIDKLYAVTEKGPHFKKRQSMKGYPLSFPLQLSDKKRFDTIIRPDRGDSSHPPGNRDQRTSVNYYDHFLAVIIIIFCFCVPLLPYILKYYDGSVNIIGHQYGPS